MRLGVILVSVIVLFSGPVLGQGELIQSPITQETLPLQDTPLQETIPDAPPIQSAVTADKGVQLRALDRLSGELVDFELTPNQTKQLGRIQVSLTECRYPTGNPSGDAAAYIIVRIVGAPQPVFQGWMLASSPALNAMDHPRYDVWVLRCITS